MTILSNERAQREQQYRDMLYAERVAGASIMPTREQHERVSAHPVITDPMTITTGRDGLEGYRQALGVGTRAPRSIT